MYRELEQWIKKLRCSGSTGLSIGIQIVHKKVHKINKYRGRRQVKFFSQHISFIGEEDGKTTD